MVTGLGKRGWHFLNHLPATSKSLSGPSANRSGIQPGEHCIPKLQAQRLSGATCSTCREKSSVGLTWALCCVCLFHNEQRAPGARPARTPGTAQKAGTPETSRACSFVFSVQGETPAVLMAILPAWPGPLGLWLCL